MKILHTSDWHVGKTIRGQSRIGEHEAVLAEITAIASDEAVDLVLVTGDLFDSAAPPPEAERVVFQALLGLAGTGASVLVIAGNHDNERRLQAVTPLLALGRIITRPAFLGPEQGGIATVTSRDGSEQAKVALIPFLSQRYVIRAQQLMDAGGDEHGQRYAAKVSQLIAWLCEAFGPDTVNIVAAHLMVDGGKLGGGERLAQTIFDYSVPAHAFPASAHYAALGHLHRTQRVPGAGCPAWYAGSPLQLDFGETSDEKGVLLVEAAPGKPASAPRIMPLRSGRRLVKITGTLAQLAARAEAGDLPAEGEAFVKVVVQEATRVGLADEVRALVPDAVDVVIEAPAGEGPARLRETTAGRSPHDLFASYLAEQGVDDERVAALFDQLLIETSEGANSEADGAA